MAKNHNLKELILSVLKEKDLSKKGILEEIREKSDRSISDKTINETLMILLRDKCIYIAGYDFSIYDEVKRIQSIKADGIIFGIVEIEPIDIDILIKQLESDDSKKVSEASTKLKAIFRGKMEEIKSRDLTVNTSIKNTNFLFNKVIYYLNTQSHDQKVVLRNKLSWSLSNESGSTELFKSIINYTKSQK